VRVVYEAGPQGYTLYDAIRLLGHEASVVAPVKGEGRVKTNKRDARMIAQDWLAGRAKEVVVPGYKKRVHRQVLRLRNTLMKEIQRFGNRINGMMRFFGESGEMESVHKDDSGYLDFCRETMDEIRKFIMEKKKELETALSVIAKEDAYRDDIEKLTAICGIGKLTALEIVLGVADVRAFRNSDAFASGTGLCPGERSTGEKRRPGSITRHGPARLRAVLIQCAWSQVTHDDEARARYEELKKRRGKKRAIVAMARRLAVRIWHTLCDKTGGCEKQG
jgi:transposase